MAERDLPRVRDRNCGEHVVDVSGGPSKPLHLLAGVISAGFLRLVVAHQGSRSALDPRHHLRREEQGYQLDRCLDGWEVVRSDRFGRLAYELNAPSWSFTIEI